MGLQSNGLDSKMAWFLQTSKTFSRTETTAHKCILSSLHDCESFSISYFDSCIANNVSLISRTVRKAKILRKKSLFWERGATKRHPREQSFPLEKPKKSDMIRFYKDPASWIEKGIRWGRKMKDKRWMKLVID